MSFADFESNLIAPGSPETLNESLQHENEKLKEENMKWKDLAGKQNVLILTLRKEIFDLNKGKKTFFTSPSPNKFSSSSSSAFNTKSRSFIVTEDEVVISFPTARPITGERYALLFYLLYNFIIIIIILSKGLRNLVRKIL